MTTPHPGPPVLLIGGPTASGKSSLALQVAERIGGEVVSADAMTVWRGLDVGTAKPSADERARVPHHCIDVRDVGEEYNVSHFVAEVDRVRASGVPTIIAGGTPFWLAALVRPFAPLPPPDPRIRAELEQLDHPWNQLEQVDPVLAQKLHPNDHVRIIRALEVHRITKRPMSEVQRDPPPRPPIPGEVMWLDRPDLRQRIAQRLQGMVEQGYLDETHRALHNGADPSHRALSSFAYRHIVAHLQGRLTLEDALQCTERDTWRLARKQRTWSRGMGWRPIEPESHATAAWEAARRVWPDRC